MRSQFLSRRTRSLVKAPSFHHRALLSSTHALRYPRKDPSHSPEAAPRLSKRSSSSVSPPPAESDEPTPPALPSPAEPPPDGAEEKPKRRTRSSAASKDAESSVPLSSGVPLPSGLEILWTPESDPSDSPHAHALPPPEMFDEILHNFHITMLPRTQHQATYLPPAGPLVEPTFALYCPIEGGDVYVDETVRELARRTGSEVVMIDAVQLAAGASGQFGKAASVLQLPNNPLHLSSHSSPPRSSAPPSPAYEEDDDDWDDSPPFMIPTRMTLQVLTPGTLRPGRPVLTAPPRTNSMIRLKQFFDEIINVSAESSGCEGPSDTPSRRPRIIYIRDFATLAPTSASWYPALQAAVRQRRQGPISRSSSPVLNPTTIVFGITPSIVAPSPSSSMSGPGQGLMNLLMSRNSTSSTGAVANKTPKTEYGEDAASDRAREKRMMARFKRWARGDASQDLPQLASHEESDEASRGKPDVVIMGGADGLPAVLNSAFSRLSAASSSSRAPAAESESRSQFFRTSFVVPNARTPSLERATRMSRRREINELTVRMGVAAVGGELGKMEPIEAPKDDPEQSSTQKAHRMWEEWGKVAMPWSTVRRIADRAVGSVIAARDGKESTLPSLEPTPITWLAVYEAWANDKAAQDLWKSVLIESPQRILREHDENEEGQTEGETKENEVDEVVERIKRDPDLDAHEARLLGCIVDKTSLTTTFSQVYLPDDTIDAVRTIVSLPLLFPSAFQHGLLKEHRMTGLLLFGPPGTGKTLVVRALAKEAGCRMLAIKPSDVMDMYVGEGEKLVRGVFSLARKLSPCVVFLDELDALLGARVSRESGGGIAHRGVITEFMQEMDGLRSSKEDNVIVIGATNRPFDLDDAVLRRLPRRLLVDLPGEKEREGWLLALSQILKILLRDETIAPDVDTKQLAKNTQSFSGSDLKHLCVSAVLDAVKERVTVPWRSRPSLSSTVAQSKAPMAETQADNGAVADATTSEGEPIGEAEATVLAEVPAEARVVSWHNFEKALKEISPSSSESLGSLADLRKWNEEFGEGRKGRKQVVWGKGKFGFTVETTSSEGLGKVEVAATADTPSERTMGSQ
ncbi:hypothetical protein POSPLADRAFT_1136329 [Postia placenta MAD-698-R-SB12]|uniref:AAA+ ATPase domain-containing protein n=1 Tax=Postia placenta MAD-698-R-SB12 TaxID=670580 RepID=A0A1X6N8U8_9APHY|nr:hypothetical protein POSPLADRAFT_1136329 [Postia placenta MAD-698-R-SB12]OSX65067.1 hypothetical protein POSPLADRAFT_1136329 [Postia placenta MAD-698-R-SB12]